MGYSFLFPLKEKCHVGLPGANRDIGQSLSCGEQVAPEELAAHFYPPRSPGRTFNLDPGQVHGVAMWALRVEFDES